MVDLSLKAFQEYHGLSMHDTDDMFNTKNWQSTPVETHTKYSTMLGYCSKNYILGNCTTDCTDLYWLRKPTVQEFMDTN